ncbi:hypothetical protein, partial [Cupriavidus sp. DL-D2]|uniref:hypothetical protein n=1 Tax=Cupriavidus sp. DL-D2 TaxID=3144974 RepID=UPI0032160091
MSEKLNATYLCMAWGETDFPAAAIVTDMDTVRAFLVEQWLGSAGETDDDGVNLLDWAVQDMQEQWALEGDAWKWEFTFEIGGVSVQRVGDFSTQQPARELESASQPGGWEAAEKREADYALAYKHGWINCAKWADRVDFVSDIGSAAYDRDMATSAKRSGFAAPSA